MRGVGLGRKALLLIMAHAALWMLIPTATSAQAVPPQCQSIANDIKSLEADRASLQADLKQAAGSQKSAIAGQIKAINSQISAKQKQLNVCVEKTNPEKSRLLGLLNKAYSNPKFGDQVVRGFLVKQVGGPTLAEANASTRFQPLSTLKLLPYLYTMIEVDKGNATLKGTTLSWVEATKDDPATSFDERRYEACLQANSPNTKMGSAALADALPTMMWESHNRTLEALFTKYGPANLTALAHQLGLTQTEMYDGCPQPNGPSAPWVSNRSTLYDLAKIFEGVEKLQFVTKAQTRQAFFDNMINLNYDGASYKSPITGQTTGPLNNGFLREIVKREAGPAKQGVVEDFLKQVVLRGKGGSGGPSNDEFGYSDFLYVTLPFKEKGQTIHKTFVVGWFIYNLKTPPGCPESMANDKGTCQSIWQPERDALEKFRTEIHAAPIQMALKTW